MNSGYRPVRNQIERWSNYYNACSQDRTNLLLVACCSTMSISIKDDDAAFRWVKEWFLEQRFLKRIRSLDIDTTLRGQNVALIPAPGSHWFWRSGRPFRVDFYRNEESNAMHPRRREWLAFRTIGRNQGVLWQFVNEVVECHRKNNAARPYLYVYNDGWSYVEAYVPRLLEDRKSTRLNSSHSSISYA